MWLGIDYVGINEQLFFTIGYISLWVLPVFVLGLAIPMIRKSVTSSVGKVVGLSSFLIVLAFCLYGLVLIGSIFLYGV